MGVGVGVGARYFGQFPEGISRSKFGSVRSILLVLFQFNSQHGPGMRHYFLLNNGLFDF